MSPISSYSRFGQPLNRLKRWHSRPKTRERWSMLLPSSSRIWADLLHSMKRPPFFGEPHGGRDPNVSSIRCNPVSVGPTEPLGTDRTPVFPVPELWSPRGRCGVVRPPAPRRGRHLGFTHDCRVRSHGYHALFRWKHDDTFARFGPKAPRKDASGRSAETLRAGDRASSLKGLQRPRAHWTRSAYWACPTGRADR